VPDAVGYIAGAARGTGLDAISVVARARNHLQANRSLGFCFEILI
jgi:hypothetical protein